MRFVKKHIIILLLLSNVIVFGKNTDKAFSYVSSDTNTIHLGKLWKYHQGDDMNWAKYNFDDSQWDTINIHLDLDKIPKDAFTGICWFRTKVVIDSSLIHKPLGLAVWHAGASEIYIDGKLVYKFGKVGLNKIDETPFIPSNLPIGIEFDERAEHVIAIRYSNQHYLENYKKYEKNRTGIFVTIKELNNTIYRTATASMILVFICGLLFSLLFTLSFVHLLLFLFYKKDKTNFYYSLFTFFFSLLFLTMFILSVTKTPVVEMFLEYYILLLIPLLFFTLILFLYSLFYNPLPKIFWIIASLTFLALLSFFIETSFNYTILIVQSVFATIEAVRVIVRAMIKKYRGSKILGSGVLFFALFITGALILVLTTQGDITLNFKGIFGVFMVSLLAFALLSVPISMSVYLAKEFSMVNKDLEAQKENLELRVLERTAEVVKQKKTVEEKQKEITDSITYAKRIQEAILPPKPIIKELLPNSFFLYKPKDIVSGDFYWVEKKNDKVLFAAVDCTGHGVPGAFVSIVGHNGLNRSVNEFKLTQPAEILNKLNELVEETLHQKDNEVRDGMDISLCSINFSAKQLEYAGANNPLYLVRNGEIIITKADKQPIGGAGENKEFINHVFEIQKGDAIYLFSDGFADQFGGIKGKKFRYSQFRELLLSVQDKDMAEQMKVIDKVFEDWKGNMEQLDDVCIIGVRV